MSNVYEDERFLMESFWNGDEEALKYIYKHTYKGLLGFCINIIESVEQSEDILATVYTNLFVKRRMIESYDHIRRWIYICVRNAAIDYMRYRTKSREIAREILATSEEKDDAWERVELQTLKEGLLLSMLDAIEALPRQRRIVVKLYFFEKKDTFQIAEQLEIGAQTVLNHKTRAIESLRHILNPKQHTYGTDNITTATKELFR